MIPGVRRCRRCRERKPVERFPAYALPRNRQLGSTRPAIVCWYCLETEAAALEVKKAKRRATWTDPATGVVVRRCAKCLEVKPLYSDYYIRGLPCPNSVHPATGPCKACHDEKTNAYRERVPEKVAAWQRESTRRHHKAIMADPVRKAQYREDERIRRHIAAEAEGRKVRRVRPRITQPTGPSYLPSEPLAALVTRRIDERVAVAHLIGERRVNRGETQQVCDDLGVTIRTYTGWRSGEYPQVRIGMAERVLLRAGVDWFSVYSYDDHAAQFLAEPASPPIDVLCSGNPNPKEPT